MTTQEALDLGTKHLAGTKGHAFDLLNVTRPVSPAAALNLAKVVSKLSPLLGNLLEFNLVEVLNDEPEFKAESGEWKRQDPGFPDAIFTGITPTPGFEIKAWFPLATEITGRFKDSQNHFVNDNIRVALVAWLPDHLIYGKPKIIDVFVATARSIAESRDNHYHNPPDYLVTEPRDTSGRTANLQQTNTNGLKFQGTPGQFAEAVKIVDGWGPEGKKYKPTPDYQTQLQELIRRFPYRLDTNYAKLDRVVHLGLETFKSQVLATNILGMTVAQWARVLGSVNETVIKKALSDHLEIKEEDATALVQ